ncbi:hypothetical protein QO004_000770 [Rhizobium mesoamericanum]|nr:hypothetical protein [Rhizobium mesoamericanum]
MSAESSGPIHLCYDLLTVPAGGCDEHLWQDGVARGSINCGDHCHWHG